MSKTAESNPVLLTIKLAYNDFKQRFAGSVLGIIWAFVSPVMTVLLYWIVFEKFMGMRGLAALRGGGTAPYVLYIIAGLIPWFFFAEGLTGSTAALLEYNYLVKKVLFNVRLLPLIKLISASFIHLFLLIFMLIFSASMYGIFPGVMCLQLLYYSVCMLLLLVSLSLWTSSIVVFFRDLSHIISILLQFLMWGTPILWYTTAIPEHLRFLYLLNPIYYVVEGYRKTLFEGAGFWERPIESLYFFLITSVIFISGTFVFKKLQPHFADVL